MLMLIQVFLNRYCEIVQKLFILIREPDLDPEPKKVSEHGPRNLGRYYHYGWRMSSFRVFLLGDSLT